MKYCWLVEFFTYAGDTYQVVFRGEPSFEEVMEYLSENDWLAYEFEQGNLSWEMDQIDFIENTPKEKE